MQFAQARAMALTSSKAALQDPGQVRPLDRRRLAGLGLRREADAPTQVLEGVEEVQVLSSGASELGAEAQAAPLKKRPRYQHVAAIAAADGAVRPDRARRVQVGAQHPLRRLRRIDRP